MRLDVMMKIVQSVSDNWPKHNSTLKVQYTQHIHHENVHIIECPFANEDDDGECLTWFREICPPNFTFELSYIGRNREASMRETENDITLSLRGGELNWVKKEVYW